MGCLKSRTETGCSCCRSCRGEERDMRPEPAWKLWDVDSAREIAVIPCGKSRGNIAFDATGKHVAIIDGTNVTIWNAITGAPITTLRDTYAPSDIMMNADGTLLASFLGRRFGPILRGPGMINADVGEAP